MLIFTFLQSAINHSEKTIKRITWLLEDDSLSGSLRMNQLLEDDSLSGSLRMNHCQAP